MSNSEVISSDPSNTEKPVRGVFWIIEDELFAFPFQEGTYENGIAKSGNTYNHKKLWEEVKPKGCRKPYNYYPRGRVELSRNGKVTIYLSSFVSASFIPSIKEIFGITTVASIAYDCSVHYRSYLDDGWAPDK